MKTFTLILLALFLPFFTVSQWSTDPAINNAVISLSGEQAIPKIATCPNGDTYIGTFSSENGNYNVRLQRLNAQGVPQWAANGILISDNPQDTWLTDWDMAADNANHAILVFPDIRNGGANVVAYRISPAGGFTWGDDGIVLSTGDGNYSPKVTATNAGNAIIAWQQDDVVHVQKINPAGTLPWGSGGILLSQSGITFSWPQLLPVGSDEFIMKYFQDSGSFPAITRHIYAQKYNAAGSPVWSSPAIVSDAGGISPWTQIMPFINDGSDGFYLAWHDDRDNNMLASTWVNHISNSGAVQYPANGTEASTLAGRNHYYPALALPPGTSNVIVFWNEMDGNQNNRGIYGQKISSTGTRLWASSGMVFIEISPVDVYPEAARNSPTDAVLFYSESVGGTDYQLKAFRINTDGAYLWTPSSKMICSVASSKVHVDVNNYANNQWILAWEDDRDGESDIYAQNIQLDGSLGPYDPQEGTIEGVVTLVGGAANVTQVTVSAGEFSTQPDNTGFYSMIVTQGTYEVIGSLAGYAPDTVFNVVVVTDQTTGDVDLTLEALPTGYISGNVTLNGGSGNVTDVEVVAGNHVMHPDSQGNYLMEIEIGTYDVTAQLDGYISQTESGIVVMEGLTTIGVDFILDPVPTTGFITGTVILAGGTGEVTQVEVTAGDVTVNPDADGVYLMEVVAGTYEVTASLPGYLTGVVQNVVVVVEQTTPDIDFFLYEIPNVGYIQGTVTLVNGNGDITEATVTAGSQSTHPSSNGNYVLGVPEGTYTVIASHPYAEPEEQTGIVVVAGQNTEDVDFVLEIIRADLIVWAMDNYGFIMNDVDVEIEGPEGILSGTITDDSLVFANQPYGIYNGTAWYENLEPVTATDTLSADDHDLMFYFIFGSINEHASKEYQLAVSPNPFANHAEIEFVLREEQEIELRVFSQQGLHLQTLASRRMPAGTHRITWDGTDEQGSIVAPGVYWLVMEGGGKRSSVAIVLVR